MLSLADPSMRRSAQVIIALTLALLLMFGTAGAARPSAPATAASPWTTFAPSAGLAGNSVLALYQDGAGFLWAGTDLGLSVATPQGDWQTSTVAEGLLGNVVLDIIGDPADPNRIWIATDRGVTLIDHAGQPLRRDGYHLTHFTTANGLTGGYSSSLAFDRDGRLWVGTSRITVDGNEDGYGVSVIDLGGTPTDTSDDQVRHYIADTGGISGNAIRDIAVDGGGVVWVATNYGLNAFSADTWTSYLTGAGLPSNDVTSLISSGTRLWVATAEGIALIDHQGTPHNPGDDRKAVFVRPTTGFIPERINRIARDSAGRIWFGGSTINWGRVFGIGLGVLDPGEDPFEPGNQRWTTLNTTNGLASDTVQSFAWSGAGQLWVGTARGLNRLSFGTSPFAADDHIWETFTAGDRLAGAEVLAIAEGGPEGVWLGTDRGLNYLDYNASPADRRDDRWLTYTYYDDYLADDYILALAADRAGRVWVGTYYGLSVIDTGGTPADKFDDLVVTYSSGVTPLAHNQINDIAIDSAGRAWIASGDYLSGALQVLDAGSLYDEGDDTWGTFSMASSGLPDPYVRAVALGPPGVAWVGTQSGAARLTYGPQPFDRSDDAWAIFTSANSGLAFDSVRDLVIDRSGNVWFALALEGVSVYSTAGIWQSFSKADGLANNVVRGLLIDRSGLVWMGTAGGGISLLNHRGTLADTGDDRWYRFSKADGLGADQIRVLQLDRWGQVWAGTAGGGVSLHSATPWTRVYLPLVARSS